MVPQHRRTIVVLFVCLCVWTSIITEAFTSPTRRYIINCHVQHHTHLYASTLQQTSTPSSASTVVGKRLPINENYPGLQRIHSSPDVYVIENFLDSESCDDLINKAKDKGTQRSPVAYAGWTDDIKD